MRTEFVALAITAPHAGQRLGARKRQLQMLACLLLTLKPFLTVAFINTLYTAMASSSVGAASVISDRPLLAVTVPAVQCQPVTAAE